MLDQFGLKKRWRRVGSDVQQHQTLARDRVLRPRISRAAQGAALPVQRLDTRLMSSATVGVCLGSVCGISLMIVASKWPQGHVVDPDVWIQRLYYAAFFGAIAWAFLRGGAKSAVHLLWAAVLTLGIPLTTLLAWLAPGLGPWAHASAASLGVDMTAIVGALCFAWMARATARRVRNGPRDSVWADNSSATQEPSLPGFKPAR